MEMITISAKTLDEAITKALLELQTTSEHLYYEVAQKESTGFLGLFGGKPCVIRARVMEEEEEKKKKAEKEKAERAAKAEAEKAERAARAEEEKARQAAAKAEEEKKNIKSEQEKSEKPAAGKSMKVLQSEETNENPAVSQAEKTGEKPQKKNFEQRDFDKKKYGRRDRGEGRERRAAAEPKTERQDKEPKVRQEVKMDEAVVQQKAKEFLEQVFGSMGMTVSVETTVNKEEGELQVMMTGDDMGILIGKRGQTLDSLQYLVSLVVNKETEGYLRVKLDTENYRERRKDTLETLARNIAYKVKRTKRPVSLEPMNPYERRIIHSALQNDRYVVTRSEGEDPYRHVVIFLKRDGYNKRDRYSGKNKDSGNRDGNRENNHNRQTEKVTEKTEESQE